MHAKVLPLPLRRLLVASLACLPMLAAAATFQVQLDTTPLAGQTGYMAFDLYQGDPGTSNQVDITSFLSTATLGAATPSGNVSGSLPGTVTLASTAFFNEFLQAVVFGAGQTSFNLTLSDNYVPGNNPDSFALFLLDDSFNAFTTSDPSGANALLGVDLLSPLSPQTYASDSGVAVVSVVPEPGSAALLCAGLLLGAGWWRRASARSDSAPRLRSRGSCQR